MNTPLHIAIQNGNIEIVKALLADGCDLGARNADGLTPLDLATKLNHDEIVRLLLERGAGRLPPPPMGNVPLEPHQRKKRISFWLMLVFITCGVLSLIGIAYELITIGFLTSNPHPQEIHKIKAVIDVFYFFLLFPCLAASLFCYFFFLFRIWEEVPREFARTTPGMAAGLSLIPFFSWYWMFVALGGLYQDMNKTMESWGQEKRFNATLIITACVVWLVGDLISIMQGMVMGIVSVMDATSPIVIFSHFFTIVWSLLWCVFTLVIYWIIRKNVLKFMDIKSGV
ncbi:MAG: ankyrin repeat domain-containing protein [Planctomycetaceae bacterium]|nr:ankyrin repeat domain-containing protein [Planctomycetaceae bacterium]